MNKRFLSVVAATFGIILLLASPFSAALAHAQGGTEGGSAPETLPVTGGTPLHAGWLLAGAGALVAAAGLALPTLRRATAPDPIRRD